MARAQKEGKFLDEFASCSSDDDRSNQSISMNRTDTHTSKPVDHIQAVIGDMQFNN